MKQLSYTALLVLLSVGTAIAQVPATGGATPAQPAAQPATTPPTTTPAANTPATAAPQVQQTAVQQSNNALYNQDQNSKESYQQIQVQSIQQVATTPAGTPQASQASVQAADVIAPAAQSSLQLVPANIATDVPDQAGAAPASQILPITTEQAASEDFPFFAVTAVSRPERAIMEKRVDLRALTPEIAWQKQILNNARAVAVVVEKNKLHAVTDSIYQLDVGLTLGQQFRLCPGTPFLNQPVIGVGTAFISGEQTMITANHVFLDDPGRYAIIFGFEMVNKTGAYEALIPLKDIYFPTRIIQASEVLDVAVFEVSRPLKRPVLQYSLSGLPPIYSSIYMIGHPYGLPKKVALNASVQSNGYAEYFYTTLFASQGNSGSPVFDLNTNRVIGVLVSGEVDYTWNGSCNVPSVCRIPYCKGEKVISIGSVPGIRELIEPPKVE
nr:serine protease [uncultured Dyadobacter sp.]